ncbi:hypothetical protein [Oceanobacillus manasiensis]|uniref:hypothetical protein n=1 Tax=Oceanobacillus manasiensis TaxID=586413 RepID=UPI0005A84C6D|nr:hypothetical protein [Oceanobacillus manasiensis]
MKYSKKQNIKRLSIILAIFFLSIIIITWSFPYASLSFEKAYTLKKDPLVVEQYVEMLDEWKRMLDENEEQTKTYVTALEVFEMFEQSIVGDKAQWRVTKDTLEDLLFHVVSYRDMLLTLVFSESYDEETKMYLKEAVDAALALEDDIVSIQQSKDLTRKDLGIRLGNLHGEIGKNLDRFMTFYRAQTGSMFPI